MAGRRPRRPSHRRLVSTRAAAASSPGLEPRLGRRKSVRVVTQWRGAGPDENRGPNWAPMVFNAAGADLPARAGKLLFENLAFKKAGVLYQLWDVHVFLLLVNLSVVRIK